MRKIVYLTSVHQRFDTRIFLKQCRSLANAGYAVSLVVADDKGDEVKDKVSIYDVGVSEGRLSRMFIATQRIYKKACELNGDIYHLHDPELIPIGLKLKRVGKTVIFDAHEDLPKQMLGKPYLKKPARIILSKFVEVYEKWMCPKFDAIITATPFIRDKFLKINQNTTDINNFPILSELANSKSWTEKKNEVCYIGGIARIRGIQEIVSAMAFTDDVRLNLGGQFNEKQVEALVKKDQAWSNVNELGFLSREQVARVLGQSKAGLVTLHPVINYIDALPVKLFEYMAAGIPVIASNFPLWREIVEGNQCGLCVDPLDTKKIGKAINYLIENPIDAKKMGQNGRKAVEEKYNWNIEESKLLDVYQELLN